LVKTINRKVVESSGEIQVIPWDGYGENGKPLSNGIYPYRIILQGGNESAMASQKIVILR
jgi:hypothetical protein